MRALILPVVSFALAGCTTIASTAVDVVTLPVKVVSAGVDAATTSQAEADEKRGREMRKAEEERGKQLRLTEERCSKGRALPTDDCSAYWPR